VLLLVMAGWLWRLLRRRRAAGEAAPLTEAESRRARELLGREPS
jgi:cytochrome c-type biogenesis protein CcmH/NrfF